MIRLPFNIVVARDPGQAIQTAGMMFDSNLTARVFRDGEAVEVFDLGSGIVTTAGVNLLATDWNAAANNQTLKLSNFHDSGTGATAPVIANTVLQTPSGGARVAGTQTNPVAGQYRSVATVSYGSAFAITEWGLFTASSAGTLWDRKTFAAINVDATTSIEFTYTLTINAGG